MVTLASTPAPTRPEAHPQLCGADVAVLLRAEIFQGIEPGALSALPAHLERLRFSRREQIYAEREAGDRLFIVLAGKVKLGKCAADGRCHLLSIVGPSEMFGELSVFDPGPRTASATALNEVDVVTMTRSLYRSWVAEHPEIAERMLRMTARRLRRTDNDLSDLVFTDVGSRVAIQLLRLAQRFGVQENRAMRLTHDLTQEEIAQLTGANRETVNKVFANFVRHGWIRLEGNTMLILEPEFLARRATPGAQ